MNYDNLLIGSVRSYLQISGICPFCNQDETFLIREPDELLIAVRCDDCGEKITINLDGYDYT